MPVVTDVDQRILGISLAQLRQIERKIFLAGGEKAMTQRWVPCWRICHGPDC